MAQSITSSDPTYATPPLGSVEFNVSETFKPKENSCCRRTRKWDIFTANGLALFFGLGSVPLALFVGNCTDCIPTPIGGIVVATVAIGLSIFALVRTIQNQKRSLSCNGGQWSFTIISGVFAIGSSLYSYSAGFYYIVNGTRTASGL